MTTFIGGPQLPSISVEAVIRRRLLVNFRVKPAVLAGILPQPFEPRLVRGWGMAGICLIGLENVRPGGFPTGLGLSTENAAHRIAVVWDEAGRTHQGVFIPRRDTSSPLVHAFGGRFFPGVYHRAAFAIREDASSISVGMRSADDESSVSVRGRVSESLASGSIFQSLNEASEFFQVGSLGFSPNAHDNALDGLELVSDWWQVQSFQVDSVESGFFANRRMFPEGSVEFDSALIMRGIPCTWRTKGRIERRRVARD